MPKKEHSTPDKPGRMDRSSQPRGSSQHTTSRRGSLPDSGVGTVAQKQVPETSAAPIPATTDPPAGLDPARHAAAQKRAQQAEILRKGAFPALMATALSIDPYFETGAYRIYLEQLKQDAGNPTDPIEVMLIEQLCMAHWRIAQLHVSAGQAKSVEAIKAYNSATARLWGEFRRTALALRVYQGAATKGKAADKLKIFKAAR